MMWEANKSKLAKTLKKNVFRNSYQVDQSFHVLDGGALLHKLKWLPNTSYQSKLNQYSRYVKSRYDRACIVFDGYGNGPYTKDHEHQPRAGKNGCLRQVGRLTNDTNMQSRNILKERPKQSLVYINIVRGIKKRRS